MPTIKTKKEMNLPELIEWGFENDIRNARYIANNTEGYLSEVSFEITGLPIFSSMVDKQDTFTVEIEEEITEDTVIPKMVSIGRENQNETNIHYSVRIGQFLDNEDFNYYVLNDDDTLTLIWRDGKLVE
ncbi:hypothetical protein [Mammaliicoccus sciuri]|uniref:hypothetical protein n=1 Tax=Mammaliicoccus sciuri TaxID=1296 RepID=UPI000E6A1F7C|nr:hypothetical protein [Mammaliicoccus sciuri]RIN80218.1 hypothetical protein BU007_07750 [Mammaliicoccus sciuri]